MTGIQHALVRGWHRYGMKIRSTGRAAAVFAAQGGKHHDEGACGW
jgi:hypothetical protein